MRYRCTVLRRDSITEHWEAVSKTSVVAGGSDNAMSATMRSMCSRSMSMSLDVAKLDESKETKGASGIACCGYDGTEAASGLVLTEGALWEPLS